jgi:hypothetical protein
MDDAERERILRESRELLAGRDADRAAWQERERRNAEIGDLVFKTHEAPTEADPGKPYSTISNNGSP